MSSVYLSRNENQNSIKRRERNVLKHCWMESLLGLLGIKLLAGL